MSHRSNRTVALTTLGCKVNQADSDEWIRQFGDLGYEIVDFGEVADAYIVNTCTVTHIADRKSRQFLRQARRMNPAALVVATGCYASVSPDEVARMVEVDLVVGDQDKPNLVRRVHSALEGDDEQPLEGLAGALRIVGARHRAFVKVADGCDKFCAFCIVPYARGRARSGDPDVLIERVRSLIAAGFREIVLTAVHMGSYGQDLEPATTLRELVRRVLDETAVERLRLSSIEPEDFDPNILEFWQDSRLCRHFHLALDSGSDATLHRMRRRYLSADYHRLMRNIRSAVPEVAVTTDVMVGFPGETEEEFAESCRFVAEQEFANIHVFPYSVRRRTVASKLPNQVAPEVKRQRTDLMLDLAAKSARRFRERFIGRVVPVLYEGSTRSADQVITWEGLTDNYLRVRVTGEVALTNQIIETRVDGESDGVLVGTLIGPVLEPRPTPLELNRLSAASR